MVVISSPSPSGKRALIENRSECDDGSGSNRKSAKTTNWIQIHDTDSEEESEIHAETRVTASMSVDTIQSLSRL